ncbi:MAG: PKD domain-containing protein [Verrucomicrobiota bacterium]|nr:PKD domain-containing protein [Verrucomicrobiota bacterium]
MKTELRTWTLRLLIPLLACLMLSATSAPVVTLEIKPAARLRRQNAAAANEFSLQSSMRLRGTVGHTYKLQVSHGAAKWEDVLCLVLQEEAYELKLPTLGSEPAVFFRALDLGVPQDASKPTWSPDARLQWNRVDAKTVRLQWPMALDDVGIYQYSITQGEQSLGTVLAQERSMLIPLDDDAQISQLAIVAIDPAGQRSVKLNAAAPLPVKGISIVADDSGYLYEFHIDDQGAFTPLNPISSPFDRIRGAAVADYDEDGVLDFTTGAYWDNAFRMVFYKGQTDATFTLTSSLPVVYGASDWIMDMCAGDFDGDGHQDFIVSGNQSTTAFYWGNGDGTFTANTSVLGSYGRAMDTADFNNDGLIDFARATYYDGIVRRYLSNGDRTFTGADVGDVGDDPYGMAVGDYDEDGFADIIANSGGAGDITYYRGNGDGTFKPGISLPVLDINNHGAMDAFDYNNDGHLDIVLSGYSNREVYFWPGVGDGSFGTRVTLSGRPNNASLGLSGPPVPGKAITVECTTTAALNASVAFTASGSDALDADTYTWTFGDGTTADGKTVSHAYATEGKKVVRLLHTDATGKKSIHVKTITINGLAPVASASGPYVLSESDATAATWKATLASANSTDDFGITSSAWQVDLSTLGQGLLYEVFTGNWTSLPNFSALTPYAVGLTTKLDLSVDTRREYLGLRFRGQILIESSGTYTFYTASDDGSRLLIDGRVIVENDFVHGNTERYGWMLLTPGWHDIEVQMFQQSGGVNLNVYWAGPGITKQAIPAANLRPVVALQGSPSTIVFPDFSVGTLLPVTLTVTDGAGQQHSESTSISHTLAAAPVAVITAPASVDETVALAGSWTVPLSGENSTDEGSSIWKYEWDFGNGSTGTGAKPSAIYTSTGTYTITLKVFDQAGQSTTATKDIQVLDNADPVAVITAPAVIDETAATNGVWTVNLSAASSTDDFGIWKYDWNFGNGATSTVLAPTVTYTAAQDYSITLKVTDNAGQTNSSTHNMTVKANALPVPVFTGPELLDESSSTYGGFRGEWDASGSTDDRGIYVYAWNFGDGTAVRTGKTTVHTYAAAGEYDLTLTITDFGKQTASLTKKITVQNNLPPVASFVTSPEPIEGAFPATLDASGSTDDTRIAGYAWYLPPIVFPFSGKQIDSTQWTVTNGYQDDGLLFTGNNNWGSRYFFNTSTPLKRGGRLEGIVATPTGSTHAMFGLKTRDFSTGSYTGLIYAVYFANGGQVYIYEKGSSLGQVTTYIPGTTYDVRIVTKLAGGATYYMRPTGADKEFTQIFDSSNFTDAWMSFGGDVYSGSYRFDDIRVEGLVQEGSSAFSPPNMQPDAWTISRGTYDNGFTMNAIGGWNYSFFFNHKSRIARGGSIEATVQTPGDSGATHAMFGFKDLNFSTGTYGNLVHCIYFDNSSIKIYEYGGHIATPANYTKGETYDVKLVSKIPTGAIYYYRIHGSGQDYTKLYESNNYGDPLMTVGGDFYSYSWFVEDIRITGDVLGGRVITTPLAPGGNVTLEVRDAVNQTTRYSVNVPVVTGDPPTAVITGPVINQTGTRLHRFSGTLSSDDHGVAGYIWDFGDGTPIATGEIVNHYFQNAGVYTVSLTVYDYAGQSDTDTFEIEIFGDNAVVAVPWRIIGDVELPHETWDGKEILVKAVADNSVKVPFTWTWDFGDGSAPVTGQVVTAADLYNLQAAHAYTGRAGVPYYATITVIDKDNTIYLDTYPIILRNKTLDIEMNVAIDEGLWYLHKAQTRYDVDSLNRGGYWYFSGYTGITSSALQAFFVNGHLETGDANQDPYVQTVIRGMNDLLTRLKTYNISAQPYGDPDVNGNGIGLSINEGSEIYQLGQVMDGIVAGGRPELIARTGPANVKGRVYRDIVQDMADQYAWGQHDGADVGGGWRYSWGDHPDNSAAQWGAVGLYAAEYHYGCTVPQWVKDRNVVWLNYSKGGDGSYGYTGPGPYDATTPSGLVQLAWNKIPTTDARWVSGERYMATGNGYTFKYNKDTNNIYPLYALAKAMRLAWPEPLTKFKETGLEWFTDETNGLARYLLNKQSYATDAANLPYFGSVYSGGGHVTGRDYPTAWSVIMLSSSLFRQAPVAVINASPNPASVGQLVTLDARGSYHQDPSYKIIDYRWDFDASDGVDFANPDGVGPVVTYAFSKVNPYTISLRVSDNHNPPDYDTESYVFNVTQPPHPPVADAGGPYIAAKGEDIVLNGSGSFDIDLIDGDSITAWDWEIDYQQPLDFADDHSGEKVTLAGGYPNPGLYNIALRVTDNAKKIYPETTSVNLTSDDYTTVTVYEKIVGNLAARTKAGKCQLTWTYPDAYKDRDLRAVVYRSETGSNAGHYEIGQTTSKFATFLDPVIDTNKDYYYRLFIYVKGSNTPLGVSNVEFIYSRDRGDRNELPSITSIPVYVAQTLQEYQYQVEVLDRENDPVFYTLIEGPSGMSINPTSGLILFTPTANQRGIQKVGIEARETRAGGGFDRQFWDLIVDSGDNRAPVAVANGPYQAILGQALNFSSAGSSDPDGDTLTFLWNFGDGKSSSVANPSYTYTADGEYVALLVVNDGKGGTTTSAFRVQIDLPNRPSEIKVKGGANFPVRALATLSIDATGTRDLDGDAMTFEWTWGDGSPVETAGAIGTHVFASPGDYAGKLSVRDARNGISTYNFTAKVGPANQLPQAILTVVTPGLEVGDTWQFDATSSTDADGDILRYSWNFGDGYRTTGNAVTHAYRSPGNYTVTLTVNDGNGGIVNATHTPHINAAPAVTSTPPPSVNQGDTFTYTMTASDADGDPIKYVLDTNPPGMTLSGATLTWVPGDDDVGSTTVTVQVIDLTNGTVIDHTFVVNVVNVNDAPVIFSTPPANTVLERPFTYDTNAYDVDDDTLVYALVGAPAGMTVDSATGVLSWQPALADENLTFTFSVTATDPFNAKATQSISLKVLSGKQPPEAIAGPDQQVFVGQSVTVDGSSSTDPNGDAITFQWAFLKTPDKSSYKGMASTATGFTFQPDRQGRYEIELLVNDGQLWSAPDVVVIEATLAPLDIIPSAINKSQMTIDPLTLAVDGIVEVNIANPGGKSVKQPYAVTVFIDTDYDGKFTRDLDVLLGEMDLPDVPDNTYLDVAGIPVSGTALFVGNFIQAFVDSKYQVVEIDETNNVLGTAPVCVAGGANPCMDASVSYIRTDRTTLPESATITVRLGSAGGQALPEGVSVAFYDGDPSAGGILLGTAVSSMILAPGHFEDISIKWNTPTIAVHSIHVRADDNGSGLGVITELSETNNSVTAPADFTKNDPPVADAGDNQSGVPMGSGVTLNGSGSMDPEGKPLVWKWTLLNMPSTSNASLINTHTSSPAFLADASGSYLIELVVNDGIQDSAPARVTVTVIDPTKNRTPAISSMPDFIAFTGRLYNYQVLATDADGDALTYTLANSPAGMTISATGLLGWTPVSDGKYSVQIIVKDTKGALASQAYTLNVIPYENYAPFITSAPPVKAQVGELFTYTPAATDYNKDVLTWSLITGPTGMSILPASGRISWTPTAGDVGSHTVKIEVKDAGGASDTMTFQLVVVLDAVNSPVVSRIPDRTVTDPQSFGPIPLDSYVTDPNYADSQITWSVSGNTGLSVSISADRIATVTYESGARMSESITFVAKNPDGFSGFSTAVYTVRGADNAPIAVMTELPSEGVKEIREGRFELHGTADDPDAIDAVTWRLSLYNAAGKWITDLTPGTVDEDGYTTGRVLNGELLADLNFTGFENGIYDLYLDVNGGQASVSTRATISLQSELKLGHLSFSQHDIVLSVGGIPLTVTRKYNSLNTSSGDFGHSWTYSVSDVEMEIDESRVDTTDVFDEPFSLRTGGGRNVTITMPDTGKRVTFVQDYESGGWFKTRAVWRAPHGVNASLTPTVSSSIVSLFSLPPYWEAAGMSTSLENFDFPGYILTTKDGTQYRIDRKDEGEHFLADAEGAYGSYVHSYSGGNISNINMRDGERIQINRQGEGMQSVEHYLPGNKKTLSLVFTRDAANRITGIYDPASLDATGQPQGPAALKYDYDASGNLVKYHKLTDATDPLKPKYETTSYFYEEPRRPHFITQIKDPMGRSPMRTEYDAEGRMVASIDAFGNRNEFNQDEVARTQTVYDRLGNPSLYLYDARGNIISTIDSLGRNISRTFDSNNRMLSETNPMGNTTTFAYDAAGNQITSTDSLGITWSRTYDSSSQLISVRSPNGHTRNITYDEQGHVLTESDFAGNVTTYTYDTSGHKISMQDGLGNKTTYTYNSLGQLVAETNPLGHVITHTYDANGNRITSSTMRTKSDGSRESVTTQFVYDRANRLISTIDPSGHAEGMVYDGNDKLIIATDKLGRATLYTYNERSELIRTQYPDGASESIIYDAAGNRIRTTDGNGNATQYTYDPTRRLVKVTYADGTSVENTYDGANNVIKRTNERGIAINYEFDSSNRNTKVTDSLGNITTYDYDKNGNVIKMTDALGHITQYQYDPNNRRTRIIYNDNTFVQYTYDALGRQIIETDQNGRTTTTEYDPAGRVISITDTLGQKTVYGYDELNNRTSITDAAGRTTRFAYDTLSRVISETTPSGKVTRYEYDAAGNQLTKIDANGAQTNYYYDMRNRLLLREYSDGTTESFTYDKVGNQLSATNAEGVVTTSYDARNRITRVVQADGTYVAYTYDASGNRASVGTPANLATYTYDNLNRLTGVTSTDGKNYSYAYDKVGNRTKLTYPNGVEAVYTYSDLNRLLSITNRKTSGGTVISSYSYTLGATGNRTKVVENTGRTVDYTYDSLYRLLTETIADGGTTTAITYTYDKVGNRLTQSEVAGLNNKLTSYSYDGDDRLLHETRTTTASTLEITYAYDANGNTLSKTETPAAGAATTTTYTYDARNRLVLATQGAALLAGYRYDARSNRIAEFTAQGETRFLIDTNLTVSQVLEERTVNGTITASYTHGQDLLRLERNGVMSHYLYDGHMSVRQLANQTATVTDTYHYDAFGNLLSSTGTTDNDYRYNAQRFDANTGFYHLRARLYNPEIGRFITRDTHPGSIYDPVTLHDYLYAGCDPVNQVDPNGLFFGGLVGVSMTMSIQTMQLNYCFMLLNIFTDVLMISNAMLEPGAALMEAALDELANGTYPGEFYMEMYMIGRDLTAQGYKAISASIGKHVKAFAISLIPLKVSVGKVAGFEFDISKIVFDFKLPNLLPAVKKFGIFKDALQGIAKTLDGASKDPPNVNMAMEGKKAVLDILKNLASNALK